MYMNIPTRYVMELKNALENRGVKTEIERDDGHKRVDIYIEEAGLNIEVDGIQHLTNPDQILADFKRDHYSELEGIYTLHISNYIVNHHLNALADAIKEVSEERKLHKQNGVKDLLG